jgi:hypothetical protein
LRNQWHWRRSSFNLTHRFEHDELPQELPAPDEQTDTTNQRRLEAYLYDTANDNERQIKRLVRMYIREGSVRAASRASGINMRTIQKAIDYVVNDFHSDKPKQLEK